MKKIIFLVIVCGVLFFFVGCAAQQLLSYTPKSLEPHGRGITIASSTPYNCRILGEVEGKDSSSAAMQGATLEKLREGALNDLKNEAGAAVGNNRRIMLRITNEASICQGVIKGALKEGECRMFPSNIALSSISYRIHAEIFECGEK
ncbi:DUF4156 domain-containing protein [Helicobacter sp. MIT 11-5569]|uniref:DUF4156 domain-containing protein n=1 Tax=Helicobacter sp. MIT 11-5569 TaxID=1548151 RepID=UPI0006923633|nr:DUF4156 domain-containing protein [Helicobacter sp. MIT 11-5569]TLD85001.1 DUF4156 domain-containing protein [Helicobacter sp. MIT 11-5569]